MKICKRLLCDSKALHLDMPPFSSTLLLFSEKYSDLQDRVLKGLNSLCPRNTGGAPEEGVKAPFS